MMQIFKLNNEYCVYVDLFSVGGRHLIFWIFLLSALAREREKTIVQLHYQILAFSWSLNDETIQFLRPVVFSILRCGTAK